jgi:hypothetical protein
MNMWKYMQGPAEGKRAACVWHRRAGKDLCAINLIQTKIVERVGTYWHMLPTYKQGRAIVWNGFTKDGRKFLDHFHPNLIVGKPNTTEMRVDFFNKSIYQVVGTDDVNSLVGTNPIGVVFSEYSLHDPAAWDYIRPILAENGGWALFIYTARGENHGFSLMEMARGNKRWFSEVLVAGDEGTKREDGKPVLSDQVIQEERLAGMPEAMIQQEFYCSFSAPFVGAYYGDQMMQAKKDNRIHDRIPYDPRLPVDTYWDLGINDTMVVWFIQPHNFQFRVIDHYESNGEGLAHYAKMLRGQVTKHERKGEYLYRNHWAPWDIEVRELGTGKSRKEIAATMGIKFRVVKQNDISDGIEAVRNILSQCFFDNTYCHRGIEALRQYRKEFDEKNKCFSSHPLHDWTSNHADAFRTFAMAQKNVKTTNWQKRQTHAQDEYAYI